MAVSGCAQSDIESQLFGEPNLLLYDRAFWRLLVGIHSNCRILDGVKRKLEFVQVIKEVCAAKMPCFGLSVVIYKSWFWMCSK